MRLIYIVAMVIAMLTLPAVSNVALATEFTYFYNASSGDTPDVAPYTNIQNSGGTSYVSGNALIINTTNLNSKNLYYFNEPSDVILPDDFVIEARLKYISGSALEDYEPIIIDVQLGNEKAVFLFIGEGAYYMWEAYGDMSNYWAADTENFHTYRIEIINDGGIYDGTYELYVDGVFKESDSAFTLTGANSEKILWGDGTSAASGVSEWKYVKHNAFIIGGNIIAIVSGNGSVDCTPDNHVGYSGYIGYGKDATCSIQPTQGYELTSLSIDNSPVSPVYSYAITNVTDDRIIAAVFNSPVGVTIPTGVLNTTQYGYGYGTNSNHNIMKVLFNSTDSADRLLHVTGFDIDYEEELAVYLNEGTANELFLGYVTGIDNSLGTDNMFWIYNTSLISGTNEVSFVQNSPGDTWGITRLGLFNTGSAFGNITGGDDEHVDGFELHFQGGESKLLEIALWDSDNDGEIKAGLNDLYVVGLPGGIVGNDVYSTWYQYYLSDGTMDLPSGDNLLVINAPDAVDDWGIKLNAMDAGDIDLGFYNAAGEANTDDDSVAFLIPVINGLSYMELEFYDIGMTNEVSVSLDSSFIANAPLTDADKWGVPFAMAPVMNSLAIIDVQRDEGQPSTEEWGVSIREARFEPYTTIAIGVNHTVVLYINSSARTSGYNAHGQLGDGTTTERLSPVQVVNGTGYLSNIVSIDAGGNHSIALRDNGSVFTWGYNGFGQLGINTTTKSTSPVQSTGISNIVAIEAGNNHNLALEDDGSVWAWGTNANGALGIGSTSPSKSLIPVQVDNTDLNQAIAIEAGVNFSVALRADGTVWSWGLGWTGVMGDGTDSDQTSPVQANFPAGTEIVSIASGGYHTIALDDDGSVWAWGYNYYGQIGDGTTTHKYTPKLINGISNVTNIYTGKFSTFAIKSDGSLWAWGMNDYGLLGDGTTNDRLSPKRISQNPGYVELGAGMYSTIALNQDGTVDGWGYNGYGQLGNGESSWSLVPNKSDISDVDLIEAGGFYSLSLVNNSVWSWGRGFNGELGDGMLYNRYEPMDTGIIANEISAGIFHSAIINSAEEVWTWGHNAYGQLGVGTKFQSATPIQVSTFANALDVEAGGYHTAVINSDGQVWTWGLNTSGQLGNATPDNSLMPGMVNATLDAVSISASVNHTAIINSDGTIWTWGKNNYGQLGDGTRTQKNTPVLSNDIADVVSLATGERHVVALTDTGDVWTWGAGGYGQLGDGYTTWSSMVPVQAYELSDVVDISAGRWHTVAVTDTGSVWTWGWNANGELGIGNTTNMLTPEQIPGLSDIVSVSAGNDYTMALDDNGDVWAWGRNRYGQLGYVSDPLIPTETIFDIYH